jgi:hypothetical protein
MEPDGDINVIATNNINLESNMKKFCRLRRGKKDTSTPQ